jgi:hypothetical protein
MGVLYLKSIKYEMKFTLEKLNDRFKTAEERISELEHRLIEIIHPKE